MDRLRLGELCGAVSMFTDLGTGQPTEHGLRTCLVAMRLAEALDLEHQDRCDVFYLSLLRFLGCTADAHALAAAAGTDDTRFFGGMAPVAMGSPREEMTRMLRLVAEGAPLPHRLRKLAGMIADPGGGRRLLEAHCEVAARLAAEMGLPESVRSALEVAYARWDGRGVPRDLAGTAIPVSVRVAIVARDLELWARDAGEEAARQVLRTRRGRAYDPTAVDAALDVGISRLRGHEGDLWDQVLAMEPSPRLAIAGAAIDRALTALGDFADLKSPMLAGHARKVAGLARSAGEARRLSAADVEVLVRSAFVHDVGNVAVPALVWQGQEEPGPARWEQLRLHPLWSERILARCPGMEEVARVAGLHHERLDGSGYPSRRSGDLGPLSGLLACAELYEEASRRAGETAAADELVRLASAGGLAHDQVRAVLDGAGQSMPSVYVERPAGLTEREVDVLALLARGSTNRQIAGILGISVKTVGAHVEHIYAKAGVNSRAAASLFAVQSGLVGRETGA